MVTLICAECAGTGETGHYGILDCTAPDCTVADERTVLGASMAVFGPLSDYDRNWSAYQLGKAAGVDQCANYWRGVADGMAHVPTSAERAEADQHRQHSNVYNLQEAQELRARLAAITNITEKN